MKKYFIAILILASTCGIKAQTDATTDRQRALYRQAADLYEKQKYAAAQQIYDQIVGTGTATVDPSTADAAYRAAVCSEKLDNNDAAFRLEEFLRRYPQSSHANMVHFYLGNFYYTRGDFERALQYYREVEPAEVEYNHRSEYNFKMGYCYFQRGDMQRASKLFAQQIEGQSKYRASSLYYYAHIQYTNGEYESALKNFRELENDRKFARIAPSYIARIYYYTGKDDELLAMAPKLLAQQDAFKKDELHQMVGEIYFNRGDYASALEQYRAVSKTVADMGATCTPQDNEYQVGYSYYMLGHYDSAATHLEHKTQCNDSVGQNALYVLADCYLHLDRKMDARSMFLQASKMSYNAKLKEDALFNYAKLSCELNQNAMGESIKSFESYLKKYPRSSHRTEAEEILTELYCSTNNYKEAIRLLEQVPNRSATLNQAYQRALINRGIELSNSGNTPQGMELYEKAVKLNAVPRMTADANYLLGEAYYHAGRMAEAERQLDRFMLSSYKNSSPYAADARYAYGYLQMGKKHYADAYSTFQELVGLLQSPANRKEKAMLADVHNRMGDCLYVQSRFSESITQYDHVINANARDADYATYQKALAYGAQGDNSRKLTFLNYIFERFDNSPLRSKAMLEVANTYLMVDNFEMALTYYNNFVKQYPQSSYVKNALLSQGLIYYNTDRNEQALATFDQLLTHYPGTDEARDALSIVKNIYIAQNRVDDYFAYVQRTTKSTISTVEQDSTTFLAAQERYQEGDYENAAAGLESYLSKFPNGLFAIKAHYLLADSYFRQGQNEKAMPHYIAVASTGANQYSERSLYNAANIAYSLGDYNKAATLYQRLSTVAESDNSLLQGLLGGLRSAAALHQHSGVIEAGTRLLKESKATPELKEEAYLAMARSCFDNKQYDNAYDYYAHLVHSSNGEYDGEARCRQAEILMQQQHYAQAEKQIEEIVSDASSDYWLAYSFILWADIYYARGNSLQAKQTLLSIIENYDGDDLLAVARGKYAAIVAAEQSTNVATDEEEELSL